MQDLPMRREESLRNCWKSDLPIPSGIFILRKQGFIPGGPTGSGQERRMQDGVLTISAYQRGWRRS